MLNTAEVEWKLSLMLSGALFSLIRDDSPLPESVCRFYLRGLVSDHINMRHISNRAVSVLLAYANGGVLDAQALQASGEGGEGGGGRPGPAHAAVPDV